VPGPCGAAPPAADDESPDAGRGGTIRLMDAPHFWRGGLADAAAAPPDQVLVMVDTGGVPGEAGPRTAVSGIRRRMFGPRPVIERAARACGVQWIRTVRGTDKAGRLHEVLRDAMTVSGRGPRLVIVETTERSRDTAPPVQAGDPAHGYRALRVRFGIDPETCTGDRSCIRLTGDASLTLRPNPDPLRTDPVVQVEPDRNGPGSAGALADAAMYCPSFYRATIISNPDGWDRLHARLARRMRRLLQPASPVEADRA
jgi:indolepyruvate ferredoxin oxidoreductase alpha subunit